MARGWSAAPCGSAGPFFTTSYEIHVLNSLYINSLLLIFTLSLQLGEIIGLTSWLQYF